LSDSSISLTLIIVCKYFIISFVLIQIGHNHAISLTVAGKSSGVKRSGNGVLLLELCCAHLLSFH